MTDQPYKAVRERQVYVSRKVHKCFAVIARAKGTTADGEIDRVLTDYLLANHADLIGMFLAHEDQERKMMEKLKA